jgi:hypothetical protein
MQEGQAVKRCHWLARKGLMFHITLI